MKYLFLMVFLFSASAFSQDTHFKYNKEIIQNRIGDCQYDGDVALREVKGESCGPAKKYICGVSAKCSKVDNVIGSCFVKTGCPKDPLDCLAIRDIVIVKNGPQAVDDGTPADLKPVINGSIK